MSNTSIISQIFEFLGELFNSLDKGTLFFGSLWDFIRYAIDIALVTFLFYSVLMFIRQTRAWQLIKGIVFVLIFVAFCGLIGLDMVGFLFNRLLYIVAILFVVLFQPELRRALDELGRKRLLNRFFNMDEREEGQSRFSDKTVYELVRTASELSKAKTGALIVIEHDLDLIRSLQSIFYKGSPMHDGGLLIRDGRIIAARCHVPLSVTMHSLERAGTRHRAAVGASEMGDTVAVVVSEERGKTSIAVNGRLFEMRSTKELEANLSYLLGLKEYGAENKTFIGKFLDKLRGNSDSNQDSVLSQEEVENASKTKTSPTPEPIVATTQVEVAGEAAVPISIRTKVADETSNSKRVSTTTRVLFLILSIFLSLSLWMYIQVITNPVVTRNITVPISKYLDSDLPDNVDPSYPIDSVELEIVGRASTINALTADDIVASINYDMIKSGDVGIFNLPVEISSKDRNVYFRVERISHPEIPVTVYSVNK